VVVAVDPFADSFEDKLIESFDLVDHILDMFLVDYNLRMDMAQKDLNNYHIF
jgi:hypothetical protein